MLPHPLKISYEQQLCTPSDIAALLDVFSQMTIQMGLARHAIYDLSDFHNSAERGLVGFTLHLKRTATNFLGSFKDGSKTMWVVGTPTQA
jgi:hypothetical protein